MATLFKRRKNLTTGQVAKLMEVAPRTVSKWCDSGKLKCYRIPGSQDRRIPRDELVKFIKEHGLDLAVINILLEDAIVASNNESVKLTVSSPHCKVVSNLFELVQASTETYRAVVIDLEIAGFNDCIAVSRIFAKDRTPILFIGNEDTNASLIDGHPCFCRPLDLVAVKDWVTKILEG